MSAGSTTDVQAAVQADAWAFLDAVYHDFGDEASTIVRGLTPDAQNDLIWFYACLLRGCLLGVEERRSMAPGTGLPYLRSQFQHPSEPPCG